MLRLWEQLGQAAARRDLAAVRELGVNLKRLCDPQQAPAAPPAQRPDDAVEGALAEALHRAARAEAWDAVQALTDELRARRATPRAGVVDLKAERAKRERGAR